jgi:hypothetical protein
MKFRVVYAVTLCAASLFGCGGSSDNTPSDSTLSAGESATISAGQTLNVPSDTVVTAPNGDVTTVTGDKNTINTPAGSVVKVAASATGPADNTVVGQ